jgi:hypothetical protein
MKCSSRAGRELVRRIDDARIKLKSVYPKIKV